MSSWVGFTDRLRRHGRTQDKTTRGYCDTAAQRIEDLEDKMASVRRVALTASGMNVALYTRDILDIVGKK